MNALTRHAMRTCSGEYVTPLPLRVPTGPTTGQLVYLGDFPMQLGVLVDGYFRREPVSQYQCIDCGTMYPQLDRGISCNGFTITSCPWCCAVDDPSKRASETRRTA